MRHFILASLMMIFLCCNVSEAQKVNKTIGKSVNQTAPTIFIKDKSKYSKEFLTAINGLKSQKLGSVKLIDNVMIVEKDTTKFPDDLKMNKQYLFKAVKGDQSYHLNVKRINESTLSFEFKLLKKEHLVFTEKGEANIGAFFFLASEMDEDNETGEGYGAYEYTKELNSCWFIIRIGVGKDTKNKQRAKIMFGCNDKTKQPLELKDCPTLRTE